MRHTLPRFFLAGFLLLGTSLAYAESGGGSVRAGATLNGWLDYANCSSISGWAWDASRAGARTTVDLYDNDTSGAPFATITADQYRGDLTRAGIGDGAHGFILPTPAALKDGREHTVIAAVAGAHAPINLGQNTMSCPAQSKGYAYYFSDALSSVNTDNWSLQGDAAATPSGLTSASATGGSLISRVAVPDGSSEYEVRALLNLKQSGGVYTLYLRASPDALAGPAASGNYYAVEVQNPTFTDAGCAATLVISKRSSDTVTTLRSESVACHDDMALRAIYTGDGRIALWLDYWHLMTVSDSEIGGGQPGIGVRGAPVANSLGPVDLGPLDRIAPDPLGPADVRISASSHKVQLEWPQLTDDPNGTGVGQYTVSRDGKQVAAVSRVKPQFTDSSVAPGTTYTYEIGAEDAHLNRTSTFVTVTTPAAGQ